MSTPIVEKPDPVPPLSYLWVHGLPDFPPCVTPFQTHGRTYHGPTASSDVPASEFGEL